MIGAPAIGMHLRPRIAAFALGGLLLAALFAGWAILDVTNTASPAPGQVIPVPPVLNSVAYVVSESAVDRVFVRAAVSGSEPIQVAELPTAFSIRSRASASPHGNRIAVLHPSSASATARLVLLSLPDGTRTDIPETFDYLSHISWSADGRTMLLVRSGPQDDAGRVHAEIMAVDSASGAVLRIAEAKDVFEAAGVGFSTSGTPLVVTVDPSGSRLWEVRSNSLTNPKRLSPGRTRGWSLSPDASRIAFVDLLGAGAPRSSIARMMLLATSAITTVPGADDQLGVVWHPAGDLPIVGGPGGSLSLLGPDSDGRIVVPVAWSGDGVRLLAAIYRSATARQPESIEVVSETSRLQISTDPAARPIGWVVDGKR